MTTEYLGTVQGGVVVFNGPVDLPEGSQVTVVPTKSVTGVASGSEQQGATEETIGQKLVRLARKAENRPTKMPSDLAENHDHYLHGRPKRQ